MNFFTSYRVLYLFVLFHSFGIAQEIRFNHLNINDGLSQNALFTINQGTNPGLINFDPKTETYDFYPHHYAVFRYGWGEITEIKRDKKGHLGLATTGELMQFDTKTFYAEELMKKFRTI